MPEGLLLPDGSPVTINPADVEAEFAKAMSAPENEPPAPPKRPETTDEPAKPKRRGRPPKSERVRVDKPKAVPAPASPELDSARKEGVKGFVQIGAGLCLLLDSRTPDENIAFRADAVTLASNADQLADACAETAKHSASFAAALDKVTKAGPYAALVSVTLGIGAQLARNHGVRAAEMFGAKSPEDILAALEEQPEGENAPVVS